MGEVNAEDVGPFLEFFTEIGVVEGGIDGSMPSIKSVLNHNSRTKKKQNKL